MKLKVFTFNLRTQCETDGINQFVNRTGRILDTIIEYDPDLIGFQEVRDSMRRWLVEVLPELGYHLEGCGRDADCHGESTLIAIKRDKFMIVSCETKWLSFTPSVPGSTFGRDQSRCPRVFTAALLKPVEGDPFLFLNTHLDHKGSTARLLGAVQCMQYVAEKGYRFVITGDMNARPDTPEIYAFTDPKPFGLPVVDATALLGGTFHGFGKYAPEEMSKIDYIFTDLPCDPTESFIIPDEPVNGVYISDHRPVCAFVEV